MRHKGEKSDKDTRHALILDVIRRRDIDTQKGLADELQAHGVEVTQATVSRDIKELRLIKVLADNGLYKYATVDKQDDMLSDRLMRLFYESVLSVDSAGNLIVIKTISGSANAAASTVDSMQWRGIIGTIAGDDTIMIIVKNLDDVEELMRKFRDLLRNR